MPIGHLWAGRVFGTSTGNLFVKLAGSDDALTGTLHINEPGVGIAVYSLTGTFDGSRLTLTGDTQPKIEGFRELKALGTLTNKGELSGEWETSIGSAGTFILWPHDRAPEGVDDSGRVADQLHTARHLLGAVTADREQITAIADEIQRDFKTAQLIVTVVAGTEQSRFLSDFKTTSFNAERAEVIKLFIQEPEGNGVNRIAHVEFGPQVNMIMTQGGDEAWVLGINQLFIVATVVFLPSLSSLRDRAILMAGVLVLAFGVGWLHRRFLRFATIYLGQRPAGLFARIWPTVVSWVIAATAGVAAALLAAYLQGAGWAANILK